MPALDLRKELKHLYSPSSRQVEVVDVPPLQFAMIDGVIEPGHGPGSSPAFGQAVQALYGISYTLKFTSKKRMDDPVDYKVMPLEALWSAGEGKTYDPLDQSGWIWTAMIVQPDHITQEMYDAAVSELRKKQKDNPALDRLRFETFHEGLCLQILHTGPYAGEPETIRKMDEFAQANGYLLHGRHHEIYLNDPLRTDPSRLKTILRHPAALPPA